MSPDLLVLPLVLTPWRRAVQMFDRMAELGPSWPMFGGVTLSRWKDVRDAIMDSEAQKGPYIGAQVVPEACMTRSILIFQPCGPEHTAMRGFIKDAVRGFHIERHANGTLAAASSPVVPEPVATPFALDELWSAEFAESVKTTVVRTLFTRMFGAAPPEEVVEALMPYYTYGGTCILGETFHKVTGSFLLKTVQSIRDVAQAAIADTPGGKHLAAACVRDGIDCEAVLAQVADGFLFAGMFGTGHLTTSTLKRIMSNPAEQLELYRSNKEAYLVESARVDPPVTSVTVVARDNFPKGNELDVADGTGLRRIPVPPGMQVQGIISTANRDPDVFGGPSRSRIRARQFDPTRPKSELAKVLSWNALNGEMEVAPRGCPGHRLSQQVARDVIDAYTPLGDDDRLIEHAETANSVIDIAEQVDTEDDADSLLNVRNGAPDTIGHAYWLGSCVVALLFIAVSKHGLGPMSARYSHYLLSQATLGAAFLLNVRHLYIQAQLSAALGYYLFYLRARQHFIHKDQQVSSKAAEHHPGFFERLDRAVRPFVPMQAQLPMAGLAAVAWLFSALLAYYFHRSIGDDWDGFQALAAAFYGPSAMAAVYTVFRFWYEESPDNATMKRRMLIACIGGFWGVINLFWPKYVLAGELYHFLGRIADGTLYVPLAIVGLMSMDERVRQSDTRSKSEATLETRRQRLTSKGHYRALRRNLSVIILIGGALALAGFTREVVSSYDNCPIAADFQEEPELCRSIDVMNRIDSHTRTTFRLLKFTYDPETPDSSIVPLPSEARKLQKRKLFFGTNVPIEDDDVVEDWGAAVAGWAQNAALDFLRVPFFFPFRDTFHDWPDLDEARRYLWVNGGKYLERLRLAEWDEMESDEAISRWAFFGLASHCNVRTRNPDGSNRYTADFLWLDDFEVRPGYERYGARAVFDHDRKLVEMEWPRGSILKPGHPDWEHAKWNWKCSVIVAVTARDHLVGLHIQASNLIVTSAVENLGKDHPIRRFLKPHTHGAISINVGAIRTLLTENGLLHRAVAFEWGELRRVIQTAFDSNRLRSPKQYASDHGMLEADGTPNPAQPFAVDFFDYASTVERYVSDYVDVYYKNDADVLNDAEVVAFWEGCRVLENSGIPQLRGVDSFKYLLTSFLVHVTGLHQHVGNVAEYLSHPTWATGKVRKGYTVADIQSSMQSLNIGLLTALPVPKLRDDYRHLLLEDKHHEETERIMESFQRNLVELEDRITARNEQRKYPFPAFMPSRMTTGVNI